MYLAVRSVREAEPVLISPPLVATARSAMVVSSGSPDRWEMMAAYPARARLFDPLGCVTGSQPSAIHPRTRSRYLAATATARLRDAASATTWNAARSWSG